MDVALLLIRLMLVAVFAVAGIAKLRDVPGTRAAVVDFGAPKRLAAPLATGLPIAEVAVAALLLFTTTAVWGAIVALVLLAVFTVAIGAALAGGRAPDCHCFGQASATPTSKWTLARNGALIGLAVFVVAAGWDDAGTSAFSWITGLGGGGIVALCLGVALVIAVVAGGNMVTHVLRSHGALLLRIEALENTLAGAGFDAGSAVDDAPDQGLPTGVPAPAFTLASSDGGSVGVAELLAPGKPLVLLFTSPSCGPCTALMPTVGEWQEEHADTLTIALANGGALDTAHASTAGLDHVYADPDMKVRDRFEAYGTPSAVLIAPDGTIASPVAAGAEAIEHLVASAWDIANAPGHSLGVGENAPDLALPALAGGEVALRSLRGENTVVLFWNPDCGFCRDMHDDLQEWEDNRNGHSPRLVVVSAGTPDEVAEEGFKSMVLLDRDSEGSAAFYAGGTPTAVLVGSDGRVRSRVVAGAVGVMALLAAGA